MKKLSLIVILVLAISQVGWSQNIGINATGAAPAASAMLDVSAANKGLLIPRVALTATNAAGPIAAPATSLLVYNTATAGASPNNVVPGFYYWNGAAWVSLLSSSGGWSSTGNSGTTAGTNFIGTTDAVDFVVKTNNTEKARFTSAGNVGIATAAPAASAILDISAANKGLLIPRVALTATNAAGPIAAPATSLLVYNTATAGASPNNVVPGYYYWNGAAWVSLLSSSSTIPGVWLSTGNSGTTAGTNFIGTTDAKDFVIKTNNTEKVRVMSAGNVGIGTAAPAAKLDVSGTYKLGTAGTVLTNMIKTNVNINDATTFTQGTTRQITVTVTGATVNGTVIINPRATLANGIGIGWARVSAANTVIIGFTNANGTARSVGNVTFDITIIQ